MIFDEIKFKTSVDGDAIVRNLRKCYVRNGLLKIGESERTFCAADRASTNVKANRLMATTMMRGTLHGFNLVTKSSIKAITSPTIRGQQRGSRQPNPHYFESVENVLNESKQMTRFVKARGLNHNFEPSLKTLFEIRWNTLASHWKPMVNNRNWRKINCVRKYWIKNKKLSKTELKHNYLQLMRGHRIIRQFYLILDFWRVRKYRL